MHPLGPLLATSLTGPVRHITNSLPLAYDYNTSDVVFINQTAASVLPYYFTRDYLSQVWGTETSSESLNAELAFISKASFIAFDERFFDILGSNPKLERLFTLPEGTHEAPNYLPNQNKVFVSNFNYTYEYLIDLNVEPPVIENLTTTPELQSVNGGFIYQGKLIVGTDGYRNSTPPGLYIYDPATNKSEVLLNNYRGLKFNTPDDLVVDHLGQVWFVDAPFSYISNVFNSPPELPPSIYRYNLTSGAVSVVDQTIIWPNGIAFSPNNKTLYVTDTPLGPFNTTVSHAIYAFDIIDDRTLANKRTLYVPDTYFADGLKVSEKGNLFTACASSIDVISPEGSLLGKINVPDSVLNNLVFLPNGTIILTGVGGIWRVEIAEQGIVHY